jgi:hypothetical protein
MNRPTGVEVSNPLAMAQGPSFFFASSSTFLSPKSSARPRGHQYRELTNAPNELTVPCDVTHRIGKANVSTCLANDYRYLNYDDQQTTRGLR